MDGYYLWNYCTCITARGGINWRELTATTAIQGCLWRRDRGSTLLPRHAHYDYCNCNSIVNEERMQTMPGRSRYITAGFVLFSFFQLLITPAYCQPISIVHLQQAVASDMDFPNAARLFVRDWSLRNTGTDVVLPMYRLDDLSEEQQEAVADGLLRSRGTLGWPFILLSGSQTDDGDFVGAQIQISISDGEDVDASAVWDRLLSEAHRVLKRQGVTARENIYLATQAALEPLEPESDVVFFDFAPRPLSQQP